jgi:DNA-binding beta-propeller fold protein YncE
MQPFINPGMRRASVRSASLRGIAMNLRSFCLLATSIACTGSVPAQQPLVLVQSIEMPEVPAGPYADHMALDLKGERLFTTPQANKAVDVLDLNAGKVLRTISGFGNPHAILFRGDRNRLFVTDGGVGALRIFDATTYQEIKSIKLELDADGIGYDDVTGYLYVTNGGDAAGKEYTLISIIDTASEEKIGDIRVEAPGLEAMAIDHAGGRLYVDLPEESAIAVIDLKQRKVIATWPLAKSKHNMALAFDGEHKRLYVGCRDTDVRGSILVVDAETGKELDRLPIGGWVDSISYDSARGRIYASSGVGEVFTYQRQTDGSFKALDAVDTAVMAKTSLYSPELERLFVAVPHLGETISKVLVFRPE